MLRSRAPRTGVSTKAPQREANGWTTRDGASTALPSQRSVPSSEQWSLSCCALAGDSASKKQAPLLVVYVARSGASDTGAMRGCTPPRPKSRAATTGLGFSGANALRPPPQNSTSRSGQDQSAAGAGSPGWRRSCGYSGPTSSRSSRAHVVRSLATQSTFTRSGVKPGANPGSSLSPLTTMGVAVLSVSRPKATCAGCGSPSRSTRRKP